MISIHILTYCSSLLIVFANTLLDDQLCQVYYQNPSGNCKTLRDAISPKNYTLPTLELGNKANPAILMLHGWPDTAAVWVMQMEEFCLKGEYFCVVPSWIDFQPDIAAASESIHFWSNQVEAFRKVVDDAGISNFTLLIHDFGSALGYQFAYLYPEIIWKVISLDIGNDPTNGKGIVMPTGTSMIPYLAQYQQNNIMSYLQKNDTAMAINMNITLGRTVPCTDCRIAPDSTGWGYRTGWPYYNFIRDDSPWPTRLAPEVPVSDYEFSFIPSWPKHLPLLFLYGKCEQDFVKCVPRTFFFFTQDFLKWIDAQPESKYYGIDNAGHWMALSQYAVVNNYIQLFINRGNLISGWARHSSKKISGWVG